MDRLSSRVRSRGLAFLLGLVLGLISTPTILMAASADKPNIIVIYTDDQGFGDASCLNPESKFQTPNLDRLANEGVRFTNGHSADTVCTPSRYGLLTGRYCWRTEKKTGVLGAEHHLSRSTDRPGSRSRRCFGDNGYNTAMIGNASETRNSRARRSNGTGRSR